MAKSAKTKAVKTTNLSEMSKTSQRELISKLRKFIRKEGGSYLDDPNITSIGIGLKVSGQGDKAVHTDKVCIQFTVGSKLESATEIESMDSKLIPKTITIDGMEIVTDIFERDYKPTYTILGAEAIEENRRKIRMDPMQPGISVGHPSISAGTLGLIAYDKSSGAPCVLSNWHVLQGGTGQLGDDVLQPGKHDDNRINLNHFGKLSRSHLGLAGDCAVAKIVDRKFSAEILDIGVIPSKIAKVDLLDGVIKSGRTTGTTRGIVRRIDVTVKINYGGNTGQRRIGAFEIGPDPKFPSERSEISMGGDSGAVWLVTTDNGAPTNAFAGLHFAGEAKGNADEHALACYAHAVIKKLDISLTPPKSGTTIRGIDSGYDQDFCTQRLPAPELSDELMDDAVLVNDSHLIPYTHFSVCQSKSRALPRFVVWNIDGSALKKVNRKGMRFRRDRRVKKCYQSANEIYRNNPLDRGHIARRVDLIWGSLEEAKKANRDSFYYTNIAPQHERFNRSSAGGLWGKLENAVYDEVDVADLKISVQSGPVFSDDDKPHRGVLIPRSFWKLIAYHDQADDVFKAKAFVLTQKDLISDLESLELDEFSVYEVSISRLSELTDLEFPTLESLEDVSIEAFGDSPPARKIRRGALLFS